MKGLILAGGLGTRLRPLTHTGAKQLIPVANKPVVQYGIEGMVEAGIKEIGIIVGYTPERVKSVTEALGDGARFGCKITYIEQDAPRGLAHAVGIARPFLGAEPFVVYLGDNILKNGIAKHVADFRAQGPACGLLLAKVANPTMYGVAELSREGRVTGVEEKPTKPKTDLAIVGVYYFSREVFAFIDQVKPSNRGELEITEAIRLMIASGKPVLGQVVDGWWDDTGTPEAVLNANHLVLADLHKPSIRGTIEPGSTVRGAVSLGAGSVLKSGSTVKGPVVIGDHCTIGPGAYIGPYSSIGDRCVVEHTEIEDSVIVGDATLRHAGRVVESLIGRHARIEGGARPGPKGRRYTLGENATVLLDE